MAVFLQCSCGILIFSLWIISVRSCGFAYPAGTTINSIQSNGFPNRVPYLRNCFNDIVINGLYTGMYYLEISWEHFNIGSTMPGCDNNFVEISIGGNSIGKYCGTTAPNSIYSLEETVTVSLTTDGVTNNEGFNLTYVLKSIASERLIGNTKHNSCSSLASSSPGLLFTQHWPLPLYDGSSCTYTLRPQAGYSMRLTVMHANLKTVVSGTCDNRILIEGSTAGVSTLLYMSSCDNIRASYVQSSDDVITITVKFNTRPADYHGFLIGFVTFKGVTTPPKSGSTSNSSDTTTRIMIGLGIAIALCVVILIYVLLKRRKALSTSSGVPCNINRIQGAMVVRCPDRSSRQPTQPHPLEPHPMIPQRAPPCYSDALEEADDPPPPYTPADPAITSDGTNNPGFQRSDSESPQLQIQVTPTA